MALIWVWVSGLAVYVRGHVRCGLMLYVPCCIAAVTRHIHKVLQIKQQPQKQCGFRPTCHIYISMKVNVPLCQGEKVWKVNVILTNCSLRWDYTGCQELWEHSGKRKLLEQQPSNMPSNVFFFFFFTPRAMLCQFLLLRFLFFGSDTLPFLRPHQ